MTTAPRYTVFEFPSYLGSPRTFKTLWGAKLYVWWRQFNGSWMVVYELKDSLTGEYFAYWR